MAKSVKLMALILAAFTLLPIAGADGQSNAAYNEGVKLYTQKNYRAAAQQFETAMRTSPNNPDVIYYCALCAQLSSNRTRAKQLFEYLTQRFPQSRVAPMAQSALTQLNAFSSSGASGGGEGGVSLSSSGSGVSNLGGGPSRQAPADLSSVPDLVRIPFDKHGNDIIVQVAVNGRAVPFILDTGASTVTCGENHLREWGISSVKSKNTMDVGGVGEGKAKAWNQGLDLKLGPIYQKNFPVMVMDNMPTEPLLGQTFLRSFNVKVDDNSRMVLLAKKGGHAASDVAHKSYSGIEVPFSRGPGGHLMVKTIINGKPLTMMFDTGCEQTSFSLKDWKQLGFDIPADAQKGSARGVLGDTVAYYFSLESLKLLGTSRNIEQNGTPASIAEGSPASLLGMSFYGKYKYVIDTVRSVIIFEGVDH